jgi:hypothetical protein
MKAMAKSNDICLNAATAISLKRKRFLQKINFLLVLSFCYMQGFRMGGVLRNLCPCAAMTVPLIPFISRAVSKESARIAKRSPPWICSDRKSRNLRAFLAAAA